jgi:hypothetical protein
MSPEQKRLFYVWSAQSGYKEVFIRSSGVSSRVRDVSLQGDVLGIELSWQLQNNGKKGIRP